MMKRGFVRGLVTSFLIVILLASFAGAQSLGPYPNVVVQLVKYEPVPAEPGRYVDVYIKVANFGQQDAKNFRFTIEPQYPFTLDPGATNTYETNLLSNQDILIHYKLRVNELAVEGKSYIHYTYKHSLQIAPLTGQLDILVQTQDANIGIDELRTFPEKITPGQEAVLSLKIQNLADTTLKHLKVKFDFTGTKISPINGVNEQTITTVLSGTTVNFSFGVIADGDAPSLPVKVPLLIEFFDHLGKKFNKSYLASVLVYDEPEFLVNLEETTLRKTKTSGRVVLSVSNTGTSELKFVRMKILPSEDYEILSAPELYMGNLESDDFQTAQFDLYAKKKGKITLNTVINYKDNYNNPFETAKAIDITLYTGKQRNN